MACSDDNRRGLLDESRFQRWLVCVCNPGALPQAQMKAAPLALKKILIARAADRIFDLMGSADEGKGARITRPALAPL